MASTDWVDRVFAQVWQGLQRFIDMARGAVMRPWHQYKATPDPNGVYTAAPVWSAEVARLLPLLSAVSDASAAHSGVGRVALDAMVLQEQARVANLLVNIPDEIAGAIQELIDSSAAAGMSTERIAERVDEYLDTTGSQRWPGRAMTIARTETMRAWNVGFLAAALQINPGQSKRWDTDLDGDERPAHRVADGQTVPLGMPFTVDGEHLMYPLDVNGSPDNVINCVPPWESVSVRATGLVVSGFTGMLVKFAMANGEEFATTPNHPVVTRNGWRLAGAINPGDQILRCPEPGGSAGPINPDVAHRITTAEDVARAIQLSGNDERVPALFVDFDGYVTHSQVSAVGADAPLALGIHAEQLEKFAQLAIHGGHRQAGFTGGAVPLVFAEKSDAVGFTSAALAQTQFGEDGFDAISADAKAVGHGQDRQPVFVKGSHRVMESGAHISAGSSIGSVLTESGIDDPNTYTQCQGDLPRGISQPAQFEDFLDVLHSIGGAGTWHEVSSVTRQSYSGTVYDFETVDGIFAVNGYIVSNCRCEMSIKAGV